MQSKVILISHNEYALGLKKTLEMITGEHEHLYAFGLMPGDHPDDLIEKVKQLVNPEELTFILGDIAGGSVCNAAMPLTLKENVYLIAGMNLPLAMQIVLNPPTDKSGFEHILNNSRENLKPIKVEPIIQNDEDFF